MLPYRKIELNLTHKLRVFRQNTIFAGTETIR